MATLAFVLTHPAVEDIGINVMAYGQRSQRYATSQILRHQFCFELRTVRPAPANMLGIVLCHYKHPLIISWVLSLAYFDAAEKMPSPDAYRRGTDVIKALALGARFVFIGRPFTYAAAIGGTAGVLRAAELLSAEISRNIAMLGVTDIAELNSDFLVANN